LHHPNSETYFNGDGSPFDGKFPVSITYDTIGGPWNLFVSVRVFDKLPPPPKHECMCESGVCPLSSLVETGSVDFSQPFGGTPFAAGFAKGALRIYDRVPVSELFSGAGLRYVHPMTRKVKSIEGATIVIEDALHRAYTYENGRPAGTSVWTDNCVETLADGRIVEVLDDRTRITYSADGNAEKIRSSAGVELSVSQLGIELITDERGDLSQAWSLTDGLMNVVKLSSKKFRVDWYKPADVGAKDADTGRYAFTGTTVKTFTFGDINADGSCAEFELLEERTGTAFSFHYSWRYDSGAKDWVFVRGNAGGADSETSTKEKVFSEDGASVAISEWKQSGNGAKTLVATETYAYGDDGEMLVGRAVGGVAEYAATRVASGNGKGKIASETDRSGATRNYVYDTHARVVRETLSKGYADLPETTDYTYAETASDLRPRTIVHKIAGTVFKTETFSYDDDFANGKTETHSVTANGATLTSETRYYPANTGTVAAGRVKYEIRPDGTATFYEYSETAIPASVELSSNLGYVLTETQGVWENGAFAVVPAKSTRIVRSFDTRGNETRTENHVHTGEVFELVSWENKTYAPTHKVIATERSDGKTSSADYICTGAVWTIDENGVRTDNTFDAAKRLKTSTRHGARGDVVTTYAYDADGRVISETQTAGTLTKTVLRSYNAFGELASETDALGNTTTYLKSNDGLTETVTFPDGGTRTTVRNAHGETLSVTGTAVVAQYFVYGFENGLKTTTVFTGVQNSARWEKTYVDAHGRTVKTERPGFGENVVLTTENTYAGTRLVATASTGQPGVSYVHDALGNVVAQVSSVEPQASGEVSAWRKTETQTVYEKDEV
ncbi:MAG: RHS repeat protein, partial [Opitutales bacterium]|nr:RHS repeat protein [Opitutales bacterium]